MNQYPQGYGVQAGAYPPAYPPQQQGYPQQPGYGYDAYGNPQMAAGMNQQMGMDSSLWTQQYNNPATGMQYRSFFDAGDFSRTGFLDQNGLATALMQAGESEVDQETIGLMITMFDEDGNGRIDFNEFNTLMNYLASTKQNYYTNAAANGGAGVTSRDIDAMAFNSHGQFMNEIGGNDMMERGILPNINPTNKQFFSLGNVIKIAIIIGILHTLYQKNKLPGFNKNQQQGHNNVGYTTPGYGHQQQQGGFGYNGQPPQQGGKMQGGIMGKIFSAFGHK